MKNEFMVICMTLLALAGCRSPEQQNGANCQGCPETKKLEAASAVGFDGKAIRKNVDNALNKNDEHNEAVEKTFKNTNDDPKE